MKRALRLAQKGLGKALPNPMVGAVLIKDGKRIGEGYHEAFGQAHAEVNALNVAKSTNSSKTKSNLTGAVLYVTLEPCCHHGKTPPCTEAIIQSGIKKVVVASLDPSEKVGGKGIKALEEAGIEVEIGLLEEEARTLNRDFFTFHEKKRPFITLKAALSIDGKIAAKAGEETKLTGKTAQKQVHLMRSRHHAILVGAGTILSDDPHLGVRLVEGKDPLRVILKGDREIPKNFLVFRDENHIIYEERNIQKVLEDLHKRGIVSVFVEGGQEVFTQFLENQYVDELKLFVTPHILGEQGLPFTRLKKPIELMNQSVQKWGQDILMTATPQWDSNNG